MYAVTCGPAEHMRAQGKIPSWLKGFPACLRAGGLLHVEQRQDRLQLAHQHPGSLERTAAARPTGATAPTRPAVLQRLQPRGHARELPVPGERAAAAVSRRPDPAKVRIPPYQPDTPEMRADWARYYNHMTAAGPADRRQAQGPGRRRAGRRHDRVLLLRQRRRAAAQQTFPGGERHARAADRLFPAQVAAPRARPARLADQGPGQLRRLCADGALAGRREDSRATCRAARLPARPRPRRNEFVFITRDRMDERYDMMRSVMDDRWLYVRNYRPDLPYVQPLGLHVPGPRLPVVGAAGPARANSRRPPRMFWGEKPTEELYDMAGRPRQRPQPGRRSGAPRDAAADAGRAAARGCWKSTTTVSFPRARRWKATTLRARRGPIPSSASSIWPTWPPTATRPICRN